MSGWSDGLVSLSFSSRLKLRQEKKITPSHSDAQPRKEYLKSVHRPQMHASRSVQREQGDASRAPHHAERKKFPARQRTRAPATTEPDSKATSMTRPSNSTFKLHGQQPTTKPATRTRITKAASPRVVSKKTKADPPAPSLTATTAGQTTSTSTAGRNPRPMTALTSTNLNALFRTRDAPIAGIPLPVHASMSARVRSVLERRAGDYSRFLPHRVGVRKDASRPPALRTARHALSVQRDINPDQRRLALHIIEGLVRPRRQVRA
ncbi:hypothetical protein BC827DRAFT_536493 [Russula dissimulans]|nr:hypothetical protein BC827DRAFT_536493 [Russula dissimulans]